MSKNIWLSLFLIVIACVSTLLMVHNHPHTIASTSQLERRPDAFMMNANYYEYNEQGNFHSHLFTPEIIHYDYKNSSHFQQPHFMVYTDEHIPWYTTADHGQSEEGLDWIHLWGHVVIHQPPRPLYPETTIKTSSVTLHPMKSFAETEEAVTITRPESVVAGVGMTADFKKGIMTLLSHSRGVYEANHSAKNKDHS